MEATLSESKLSESESGPESVRLYVDPSCPFAWITSRWLHEVARLRPVAVEQAVMSLSVLNEFRELEPWYREFNDRAWGPARVAAAVAAEHGRAGLDGFYTEFGVRWHVGRERDLAVVLLDALNAAGLPPELAAAAADQHWDATLRATHATVQSLVGEELGTPVIVVRDAAFFGPVCTAIPRGEHATALFDAVLLAASCPQFTELKRGRVGDLVLA